MMHYRQGGKQPRNIYRVTDEHPEGQYIGVFFEEVDASVVVATLNQFLHEAKWGQGVHAKGD